jgi:hypothetical protein
MQRLRGRSTTRLETWVPADLSFGDVLWVRSWTIVGHCWVCSFGRNALFCVNLLGRLVVFYPFLLQLFDFCDGTELFSGFPVLSLA